MAEEHQHGGFGRGGPNRGRQGGGRRNYQYIRPTGPPPVPTGQFPRQPPAPPATQISTPTIGIQQQAQSSVPSSQINQGLGAFANITPIQLQQIIAQVMAQVAPAISTQAVTMPAGTNPPNLTVAVVSEPQAPPPATQKSQGSTVPLGDKRGQNTQVEMQPVDPKYKDLICYNCGIPGHYVGKCTKPLICFQCQVPMNNCPLWGKPMLAPEFLGSCNGGLGFFNIFVDDKQASKWLNITNCGVMFITHGRIKTDDVKTRLKALWDEEWPWQVRELAPKQFLIRFPAHKNVKDLETLPSFNIIEGQDNDRVTIKIMEWDGSLDEVAAFEEVWVQVSGIPPKWISWKVITQVAKMPGLLLDVDWTRTFHTLYDVIRIKVAVKNQFKIPGSRTVCMRQKQYTLKFRVEGLDIEIPGTKTSGGDDKTKDKGKFDKFDDLEDPEDYEDLEHEEEKEPDKGTNGNLDIQPTPENKKTGSKIVCISPTKGSWSAGNRYQALVALNAIDSEDEAETPAVDIESIILEFNEVDIGNKAYLAAKTMEANRLSHSKEQTKQDTAEQVDREMAESGRIETHIPENTSMSNEADMQARTADEEEANPTPAQATEILKKAKKRTKWGPIQATRQSERVPRTSQTIEEKAAQYQAMKNLEIPPPVKGVPLHHNKLTKEDLQPVMDKIIKRVAGWRGFLDENTQNATTLASIVPTGGKEHNGEKTTTDRSQIPRSPSRVMKRRKLTEAAAPGTPTLMERRELKT